MELYDQFLKQAGKAAPKNNLREDLESGEEKMLSVIKRLIKDSRGVFSMRKMDDHVLRVNFDSHFIDFNFNGPKLAYATGNEVYYPQPKRREEYEWGAEKKTYSWEHGISADDGMVDWSRSVHNGKRIEDLIKALGGWAGDVAPAEMRIIAQRQADKAKAGKTKKKAKVLVF